MHINQQQHGEERIKFQFLTDKWRKGHVPNTVFVADKLQKHGFCASKSIVSHGLIQLFHYDLNVLRLIESSYFRRLFPKDLNAFNQPPNNNLISCHDSRLCVINAWLYEKNFIYT